MPEEAEPVAEPNRDADRKDDDKKSSSRRDRDKSRSRDRCASSLSLLPCKFLGLVVCVVVCAVQRPPHSQDIGTGACVLVCVCLCCAVPG